MQKTIIWNVAQKLFFILGGGVLGGGGSLTVLFILKIKNKDVLRERGFLQSLKNKKIFNEILRERGFLDGT